MAAASHPGAAGLSRVLEAPGELVAAGAQPVGGVAQLG
jgi:hypothetical protein